MGTLLPGERLVILDALHHVGAGDEGGDIRDIVRVMGLLLRYVGGVTSTMWDEVFCGMFNTMLETLGVSTDLTKLFKSLVSSRPR